MLVSNGSWEVGRCILDDAGSEGAGGCGRTAAEGPVEEEGSSGWLRTRRGTGRRSLMVEEVEAGSVKAAMALIAADSGDEREEEEVGTARCRRDS